MTTLLASAVNPLTPVTPPPERMTFAKPTLGPRPPQQRKRTADEAQLDDGDFGPSKVIHTQQPPPSSSQSTQSSQSYGATQLPTPPLPGQFPGTEAAAAAAAAAMDPRYAAMATRIAGYYQQRCQALANFQHQRCQAWAALHRQKCQEMVQASMLVVAWYIRDRISRRRRKDKRRFRAGLKGKASQTVKITRGEAVRRWVLQVPDVTLSPDADAAAAAAAAATASRDPDEADFNLDREPTPDKDSKLFEMADNLIRSQYRKIEIPMMGTLDLDESESESEQDDDERRYRDDGQDEEVDGDDAQGDEDDEVDGDEEYDDYLEDDDLLDDDDDLDLEENDEHVSEVVHRGTGSGSRHNKTSLSS